MKEEKGSEGNEVKEEMKEEELRKWRKFCKGGRKRDRNWRKWSKGGMKEEIGSKWNGVKGEWKRK